MSEEKSVLICCAVAKTEPMAESFVSECDECGRAVWRAFSSPDTDIALCSDCAGREIQAAQRRGENFKIEPPTKEQIEELWRMNFAAGEPK
jgi:hypothetical protein